MGFLDVIAQLGVVGEGYDRADSRYRQRDRENTTQRMNDRALAEALRRDEVASGARDAVKRVGPRAALKGVNIDTITPPDESDRWGETQFSSAGAIDTPEGIDRRGMTKAARDFYASQGELEQAGKQDAALKQMQKEGMDLLMIGIANGESPKALSEKFNSLGESRITGGTTDGQTYRLRFDDNSEATFTRDDMTERATKLGLLKKPDVHMVAPGATALVNGKPGYTNTQARPVAEPDPDLKAAKLGLIGAQTESARALADQRDRPKPGPAVKPTDFVKLDNSIRTALKAEYTTTQDGAQKVDTQGMGLHASMAAALLREQPERWKDDVPGAIEEVRGKINEARGAATEQATKEAADLEAQTKRTMLPDKSFKEVAGKPKKRWIADRTQALVQERLRGKAGGMSTSATRAPGASDVIDLPTTQSELDSLPSGTRVRDPETGRVFRTP